MSTDNDTPTCKVDLCAVEAENGLEIAYDGRIYGYCDAHYEDVA